MNRFFKLILSGNNNHDWKTTMPLFRESFVYKYIYGISKCMPLLRRFYINDYPKSYLFMKNNMPME
jgi:hypothetical protein